MRKEEFAAEKDKIVGAAKNAPLFFDDSYYLCCFQFDYYRESKAIIHSTLLSASKKRSI